jgi:hypothetical protein
MENLTTFFCLNCKENVKKYKKIQIYVEKILKW